MTYRPHWVNPDNPLYIRYYDEEWGFAQKDDHKLYEMLILESFQAGLSWECVLNKREAFRRAFEGFDVRKVASFTQERCEELTKDAGIIRNRLKIRAAVSNSKIFLEIQREFGSFSSYLWGFTGGEVIREADGGRTTSPLSDAVSRDLRKRGMTFVGSTIIYSYLQAIGIINSRY